MQPASALARSGLTAIVVLLMAALLCAPALAGPVPTPASPLGQTARESATTGTRASSASPTSAGTAAGVDRAQQAAYASRELRAGKLEKFEGGGTAIYLSSGAAVVLVVILVLLIVF